MDMGLLIIQVLQLIVSVYLYQTVAVCQSAVCQSDAGMAHHEQSTATFPELIRKKRNGEGLSQPDLTWCE
ncbi:hypothetical protein J4Q44_G00369920 [Coregonus suidteri]|uniref:Secreted protein n=1 Tax=Coregonus suidteri TaxID=861788 RepID=A0AAN8KKI8_9TELE